VITLTLLHPIKSVPVQSWTFDPGSAIRIGRSTNNEVVLYSAVVSRNHAEIKKNGSEWEVVNLGANGTYINGKRIDRVPVRDGIVIRLASSGPQIQINIDDPESLSSYGKTEKRRKTNQVDDASKETFVDF
jgi:pSer/pThr/pTyr-binding forkhead associated (FHA) protein